MMDVGWSGWQGLEGSVPETSWHKVLGSSSGSGLGSLCSPLQSKDTIVRLNRDCKRACVCVCVCVRE